MSKILELRSKRNALWEQTKAFLEKNRGENGLVAPEAVEQYNKMAQELSLIHISRSLWNRGCERKTSVPYCFCRNRKEEREE